MNRGKFITLEGVEGVGKTTNLRFIQGILDAQGVDMIITREPGGTRVAEEIRDLLLNRQDETIAPEAELLMMFAARAQHIKHVIAPALTNGQWVLCDRFTDASYAYQGGGRGMALSSIRWLENMVQRDLRPDLTLLLDASVETGMARARQRGKLDRFEREHCQFFERVRQAYLQQAQRHPHRYAIINADRPLTEVQDDISQVLLPMIRV